MTQPERDRESIPTEIPITRYSFTTVTSKEIERRRLLFEEATSLRDELGPIDISTAELIREDRDDLT